MSKTFHRQIATWLFGTYRGMRREITDPLFSVGRTVAASGFEEYPSGIYVTLGDRGVYLCRADGLERGRARGITTAEQYANAGESA